MLLTHVQKAAIIFPNCDSLKKKHAIKALASKVVVLTTDQGKKYILKQRNSTTTRSRLMTVIEALGGHIAEEAHIKTNSIHLIPTQSHCKHLFFRGLPATLHNFMPGVTLREAPYPYHKLSLSQSCKTSKPHCGLSHSLIKNMSKHRDLPKIMALDTFIGNDNRHLDNLLYDKEKDQFTSIDYGDAFRTNMAKVSIGHITKLLKEKTRLSSSHKQALVIYLKTFNYLINHFTPQRVTAKLKKLLKMAGLQHTMKKDARFKHEAKTLIHEHKNLIYQSYKDSQKLSLLISRLLSNNKKIGK